MAKAAKIFCRRNTAGSSDVYTVPNGKFVVANLYMPGNNAGNGLLIDGVMAIQGAPLSTPGLAFPAGTTLQIQVVTGTGGVLTGFEYDV